MRIGELSHRTGVSIRSLRYYEEQGLLEPERTTSGYRIFTESDMITVARIGSLLDAGLGTRKIATILPCLTQYDDGIALTCSDLYNDLVAERGALMERIATLQESVDALDAIIGASPSV